jgi:hypothetical protein
MKKYLILFFTFFVLRGFAQQTDEKIAELLNNQEYFELQKQYPSLKKRASEFIRLVAESSLFTFFNQPELANQQIQELITKYDTLFSSEQILSFISMAANNEVQLQRYDKAASIYEQLIEQLAVSWDSLLLEAYKNSTYKLYYALKDIPPMEIYYKGKKTKMPVKKDSLSFFTLPVFNQNFQQTLNFVVDFGAGFCMIEEKYADLFNIQVLQDSIPVHTGIGTIEYIKIGVAKELYLGDILIRNVIFQISPHGIIPSVASIQNYEMNGLIGFPIWRTLKCMELSNDQFVISKKRNTNKRNANIKIYNNGIYVHVFDNENASMNMFFDTGSKNTYLTKSYYDRYQQKLQNTPTDTVKVASYNTNMVNFTVKKILPFPFLINKKSIVIPSVDVFLEDSMDNTTLPSSGVIGIDIFEHIRCIKIDFQRMWIIAK